MFVVLLCLLAAAVPAAARGEAELRVSLSAGGEYDSNVFRRADNEKEDLGARVSTDLEVRGEEPQVRYRATYRPSYVKYIERNTTDDVDHLANANVTARLSNRMELTFVNNFQSFRRLGREDIAVDDGSGDTIFRDDDGGRRTTRNRARATLTRAFGSRWTGTSEVFHDVFIPDDNNSATSHTLGTLANTIYGLDANTQVGGGVGFTYQDFQDTTRLRLNNNNQPVLRGQTASETFVYRVFGTVSRRCGPNTFLLLSGGPVLLQTDQDSFNPGFLLPSVSSRTDRSVDFFANARLTQRWSQALQSSLSYSRDQSDASGVGGSTIRDQVSFRTTWDPLTAWNFGLRADWVQRKATTGEGTSRDIDQQRWTVAVRSSYRWSRRIQFNGRARWDRDDNDQGRGADSGAVTSYLVFLGVEVLLDPVKLWN